MESAQMEVKQYKYFAGNEWRNAADEHVFEVREPYSGKLFARVAAGSRTDARAARRRDEGISRLGGDYASGTSAVVPEGFRDREAPANRDCGSSGAGNRIDDFLRHVPAGSGRRDTAAGCRLG